MPCAGPKLAARLDLAALTNMPAEARNILVVDMLDVINAECANLAPWGVPSAARTSPACSAAWPSARAIAVAALALRAAETTARAPPAAVTFASWAGRPTEPCALGTSFTCGTTTFAVA